MGLFSILFFFFGIIPWFNCLLASFVTIFNFFTTNETYLKKTGGFRNQIWNVLKWAEKNFERIIRVNIISEIDLRMVN